MEDGDWPFCTTPRELLECLAGSDRLTDRKLRLLACACARRVWPLMGDEKARRAVTLAERFADGVAGADELAALGQELVAVGNAALLGPDSISQALSAAEYLAEPDDTEWAADQAILAAAEAVACLAGEGCPGDGYDGAWRAAWQAEAAEQCRLGRDLFVNPLHPLPAVEPAWLAWEGGTVRGLAEAIYEQRELPAGTLDTARLAILADALEDAGCRDVVILSHLRQPGGVHALGCWAVDLVLGKG